MADKEQEHKIEVVEERLNVRKSFVTTGSLSVKKRVEERMEPIVATLSAEGYTVERVPKNEAIENAPDPIKNEADRIVISVVEERLVVEKRLFLVEEIHLIRQTVSSEYREEVRLRKEVVDVERKTTSG